MTNLNLINTFPLIINRGLKESWFKTDAVTFICLENYSDSICFKP
jgi:hypothetical protein